MLKPEQLQAVRHVYEGRNVFLWLLTGFVNPSATKFSLVLRPSHKAAMCEGPGYEATMMSTHTHHEAALWERPGYISREQGTCTIIFTERKTEYVAHAQRVCTRPSPPLCGRGLGTRLVVRLLVEDYLCDPSLTDRWEMTPLGIALQYRQTLVALYLSSTQASSYSVK